jgi:glutaredoxin
MRIAASMLLSLMVGSASAEMYRWTDSSGRTHFTDTPPPLSARDVQQRAIGSSVPGMPVEPFALQQARKTSPVTLYSSSGCEPCDLARRLLNARGIPFTEVSVASEAQLADLKKTAGSHSVPALVVGSNVYKGFEEGNYQRMLDSAGYPRAGILPPRTQAEPVLVDEKAADPVTKDEAEPAPLGPYAPRSR